MGYDPLVQPALLRQEIPSSDSSKQTIATARHAAGRVIAGEDDRILVVVGPCSIHSPEQAIEYAKLLKAKVDSWPHLLIVMRAYFEKPRTTVGWKGLINDPDINDTFQINKGLRTARKLLCDLTDLGVPVGSELLDTISPQFISDRESVRHPIRRIANLNISHLLGRNRCKDHGIPASPRACFWCLFPYWFQERH